MLKRQRPSSPTPSKLSVPLLDSSPMDIMGPDSKRRRTLPPVLDGPSRGWRRPEGNDSELYDLEGYSDDELLESEQTRVDDSGIDSAEYKSANSVLRELHTLYQHRLMFSSTNPSFNGPARSPQSQPTSNVYNAPIQHATFQPVISEQPKGLSYPGNPVNPGNRQMLKNEVHCVTERYENTNRYLGNLFLSRRRELDSYSQEQEQEP